MVRAWRSYHRFEGRSSLSTWLCSIATNVCFDMLTAPQRRAMPTDPATGALAEVPAGGPGTAVAVDPAEHAVGRDDVRLALVAALLHLPPRQRSVLLLCAVLKWRAAEVAELLDTSVVAVNSALQRARSTLSDLHDHALADDREAELDDHQRALLHRYLDAFERHDVTSLTALLH
jgi:RNA polymerase sigma-70 factor (ECF subfamily)